MTIAVEGTVLLLTQEEALVCFFFLKMWRRKQYLRGTMHLLTDGRLDIPPMKFSLLVGIYVAVVIADALC